MRACLVTVLLGFAGLCWNASPAQSQPLRTALVQRLFETWIHTDDLRAVLGGRVLIDLRRVA